MADEQAKKERSRELTRERVRLHRMRKASSSLHVDTVTRNGSNETGNEGNDIRNLRNGKGNECNEFSNTVTNGNASDEFDPEITTVSRRTHRPIGQEILYQLLDHIEKLGSSINRIESKLDNHFSAATSLLRLSSGYGFELDRRCSCKPSASAVSDTEGIPTHALVLGIDSTGMMDSRGEINGEVCPEAPPSTPALSSQPKTDTQPQSACVGGEESKTETEASLVVAPQPSWWLELVETIHMSSALRVEDPASMWLLYSSHRQSGERKKKVSANDAMQWVISVLRREKADKEARASRPAPPSQPKSYWQQQQEAPVATARPGSRRSLAELKKLGLL